MQPDAALPPAEPPAEVPAPGDALPGELASGMDRDRAAALVLFERIKASHASALARSIHFSPGGCLKDSNA